MIQPVHSLQSAQKHQIHIPFDQVSLRNTQMRWLALTLACLLMFGEAYCFDNPMAMQDSMQQRLDLDEVQFNLLYSVYSFPNIIFPFFGGVLIDKIGVRVAIFTFSSILILGQIIFMSGGYAASFSTMLVGRVVFGIGSESLASAQSTIMSHWFQGSEVSLAIGLCFTIPRLGSALNSLISPRVETSYNNLGPPMLIGLFFCIFSWICGIFLILMDRENEKKEKQIKENKRIRDSIDSQNSSPQLSQMSFNHKQRLLDKNHPHNPDVVDASSHVEKIDFQSLKRLHAAFWVLLLICSLCDALFLPFLDNGNSFFVFRFGYTKEGAGTLLMLPYFIAAALTPFVGIQIEQIGNRGLCIISTIALFTFTHTLMLVTTCDNGCGFAVFPVFLLGICYSLYSAVIIPTVPKVVPEKLIGTAFGLMCVFQNVALATFPLITGSIFESFSQTEDEEGNEIEDPVEGFYYQTMFFVGICLLCFFVSLTLYIFDKFGGNILDRGVEDSEDEEQNTDVLDIIASSSPQKSSKATSVELSNSKL